jgi:hypothetical protein
MPVSSRSNVTTSLMDDSSPFIIAHPRDSARRLDFADDGSSGSLTARLPIEPALERQARIPRVREPSLA